MLLYNTLSNNIFMEILHLFTECLQNIFLKDSCKEQMITYFVIFMYPSSLQQFMIW